MASSARFRAVVSISRWPLNVGQCSMRRFEGCGRRYRLCGQRAQDGHRGFLVLAASLRSHNSGSQRFPVFPRSCFPTRAKVFHVSRPDQTALESAVQDKESEGP